MGVVVRSAPLPENLLPASRWRRLRPFLFVVSGAFLLACLGPQPPHPGLLIGAALCFLAVAPLVVAVPWQRFDSAVSVLPVVVYCSGVVLLRHSSGGVGTGFAALFLLPVVWQGVYGTRRSLALTCAVVCASAGGPILVIGGALYPAAAWRETAMLCLAAMGIGAVVHRIVDAVRRQHRVLVAVAQASHRLGNELDEVRRQISELTRDATGADRVILYHRADSTDVFDICLDGVEGGSVPFDDLPPAAGEAWETGSAVVSTEDAGGRVGSEWHQPILHDGTLVGLLSVRWDRVQHRGHDTATVMTLIASEASVALSRVDLLHKVADLARRDELTGLPNRRGWSEAVDAAGAMATRRTEVLSVAMLDLDHFKEFNDRHGHAAGDDLLRVAASAWSEVLRPGDVLARWGGEEFALLLPGTDEAEAILVIERLRQATPSGRTFSAGLVSRRCSPNRRPDMSELLGLADRALYRAKREGRARTCVEAAPETAGTLMFGRSW